jgi:hypothetical protein
MARSILVPCGGCGYENFPQHRFCGMCGFPLPETPSGDVRPPKPTAQPAVGLDEFMAPVSSDDRAPRPAVERSEPAAQRNSAPPQSPPSRKTEFDRPAATRSEPPSSSAVSGPSFLGLAAEPNSDRERASYLLDDEQSSSHSGRFALLLIFLIAVALSGAVWHWRQQVGGLSDRILGRGSQTTPQPADTSAASPSDSSQVTPPDAAKAAAGEATTTPGQSAPAQNGQAPATPNFGAGAAPAQTPTAGTPVPDQTTVTSEPSTPAAKVPAPATPQTTTPQAATSQADDGSSAEKTMRQQDAAKAARAARKASLAPVSSSTPAANAGDSSEAEGEKYLYGSGVPQNCDRAQKSLMAAASRSDAKAQSVLGTMYATGHCAPRDLPLAYKWFAKALHQDPNNDRLSQDLRVLWNQMTPDERQLALRNE